MKKMILLAPILCTLLSAASQTAEEWLQQKETQKKYLLEQIAVLKVYGESAKKGYVLAGKGWGIIQGIKEGDLELHSEFLGSLSRVNPHVKASPLVGGTITLGRRTAGKIQALRHSVRNARQLTSSDKKFCSEVLDGLFRECTDALDELGGLTTAGTLELSDEERLQRLRLLYAHMQELYKATSSLRADIQLLTTRRLRQQVEIHHQKKALGLK